MIRIDIPGWMNLKLEAAVFDFNGTLAANGQTPDQVIAKLRELGQRLNVHVITADTFGTARSIFGPAGISLQVLNPGDQAAQKFKLISRLGPANTVAVGNGANDVLMLEAAILGIAVISREGVYVPTLNVAQIAVISPLDAIDLLLYPDRLKATLRR